MYCSAKMTVVGYICIYLKGAGGGDPGRLARCLTEKMCLSVQPGPNCSPCPHKSKNTLTHS